jgi:cellulose synthase (UDP-forming)
VESGGKGCLAFPSEKHAALTTVQRMLAAVFVATGIWYLWWRAGSFNPEALAFSATVYAAEVFGFVAMLLYLVTAWRLERRSPLPMPRNATIAVLIPTRDESVDTVRRTLMAAQRMKHAHDVWLLDDGNRLEMHVLAEELGARYLARNEPAGGKAGNLNHALQQVRAEFIAVFDADHAPAPSFLEETLGFFADERVAFVQTPQDVYNLDSFQHRRSRLGTRIWSEQALFFRVIQAGMDRLNAAFFCGSCAVVRRKAIDDIGGFATGSATEGLHTSLRFHRRGWRSVYYARSLAFGRAPTSASPYLRQHLRRGQGAMQAWRQESVLFSRGLTLGQRFAYISHLFGFVQAWQRVVLYVTPAVVLMTGTLPIAALDREFLVHFVPYVVLGAWLFEETARGFGRGLLTEQYRMMRVGAFIGATLSYFRRAPDANAASTGAAPSDSTWQMLWPLYAVLALNVVAIPVGIGLYFGGGGLTMVALAAGLAASALTAGLAAAAARFALRNSSFKRREYRFPLPVPMRVRTSRGMVLSLATDISPIGCRLVGPPAAAAQVDAELQGELLLPTGDLPVRAVVRARLADSEAGAESPAALGCEFRWGLSDERNQLELFLFGSDLQWRLNGLEDRSRPPLEWVVDEVRGVRQEQRRITNLRWSPLLYRRVNATHEVGVGFISASDEAGGTRTVASLGALPANGQLFAEEVTAAGPRGVVGRVADEQVLETHAAPIYLYRLTA